MRVVEVGERRGAYAGRLLADLGAEVLRLGGDVEHRPPFVDLPEGRIGADRWFHDLNKRVADVDVLADPDRLLEEVAEADVLLESFDPGVLRSAGLSLDALRSRNENLIVVSNTAFGQTGPWAGYKASDLVSLAAGGLLWLGGYPDTPPVAVYGGQSAVASSVFSTIATLVALIGRAHDGNPRWMDISAQESIVQALEDSIPEYDLNRTTRRRLGDQCREAGTGVFPCADGYISIVAGRLGTAKAWIALTEWLRESRADGAEELSSERWREFEYRQQPEAARRFNEVFTAFTAERTKYELYLEAQRRSIALAPVNNVDDIFGNDQLREREFWRQVDTPAGMIRFPGPPYRVGGEFGGPEPSLPVGANGGGQNATTARARGTSPVPSSTASASPLRSLFEGVRVLDYCWIGAGALVTKVLAEHGAEVIKVESRKRPDNLRLAPPYRGGKEDIDGSGYFASRNPNKRSFALDMSHPEGPAIARSLAEKCDIITNNFRPGIMERWGMTYEDLSEINPSLIYLSMPMQGSTGPHKAFVGFGSTLAALGGLVELSGLLDRAPVGTGTHYPDHIPNPGHALVALCAAMYARRHSGSGAEIELSQFESTINVIGPAIVARAAGGELLQRNGNRADSMSPNGVFPCHGDDEWCAVSVDSEEAWRNFVEVLGFHEWLFDRRFESLTERKRHEDELEKLVGERTARWDKWDLMHALQERGVAAAAVATGGDLLSDPHLLERGFWQHLDHPVMGNIAAHGVPFRPTEGPPTSPTRAAPLLGEHTKEIATSLLGMGVDEYQHLVEEGVLR